MTWFPRFVFPWALILLLMIPWAIAMGSRVRSLGPVRKWIAISLRSVVLLCLVLALAGAELVQINDRLAVFFLLDHSDSIGDEQRLEAAQWVRNVSGEFMTDKDEAGVIVFGEDPSIELAVDPDLGLRDILSYVDGSQTNLASAIRLAMAAFPQGYMKRIVLYTDGNETRGASIEEVKLAQAAGVALDVVPLHVGGDREVRLKEVSAPASANSDEPFQLRIVTHAEQESEGTLRVYRRGNEGRRLLATQDVVLRRGDNTFLVTQELGGSGFYEYEATIDSNEDTIIANNEGRAFTVVQGEPRVLYVEGDPAHSTFLAPSLLAEGLNIDFRPPGEMPEALAQFQNYDVIILSDVSSTDISSAQLGALEVAVRDLGIGLIMVGGPESFGAGGYLDTPVERALPVDMDIKQRKVLPRGALVCILHTCEFQNGNAWARDIAIAALNVLSAQDLMGVLGYMHSSSAGVSGDSWIYDVQPVGDKSMMRGAIIRASTQIGDMPSAHPGLVLAYKSLVKADAAVKRVIMISDGDPAAPTAGLLSDIADAGISVSTICINPHSANDQNMLQWVADKTGGEFYFVNNPNNLPQIFTKEAAVVKRGLLIEEEFTPEPQHESELLFGLADGNIPTLQGYVVTSPKESATIPLVSHEGDPILAHWRYGLGKAVAFTSDVTNRWAADWLGWEGFNRFWAQTVRWATRQLTPANFRIETRVQEGRGYIRVDAVDDEGKFLNFLKPTGVITGPEPDFARTEIELLQTGPGIYEASFPMSHRGVYMTNLNYTQANGETGMLQTGLALGYSREYEYNSSNIPLLEQVADLGGGRVLEPFDNPFTHDLEATPSVTPVWQYLAALAACLFLVDIFVRRVVVSLAMVYVPIAEALKKLPAIQHIIPMPKPLPQPVTGTYRAAREHRFEASGQAEEQLFGIQVRQPVTTSPGGHVKAATETAEPAPAGHSEYTQQLLAAKERAIAKRTRRSTARRK